MVVSPGQIRISVLQLTSLAARGLIDSSWTWTGDFHHRRWSRWVIGFARRPENKNKTRCRQVESQARGPPAQFALRAVNLS
jgi:hypothetical protein